MKKGLNRGDIIPVVLLCLTWLLILITWGVSVLPRGELQVPEVDVGKMKMEIRGAGLEPREARYYRVLPEDQEEK